MKNLIVTIFISTQLASIGFVNGCSAQETNVQQQQDQAATYGKLDTKNHKNDSILVLLNDYGASDAYLGVAQDIINKVSLNPSELKGLGDEINAMYGKPDGGRFDKYSLLKLTVEKENIDAAEALLKAGADPMANNNVFVSYAANKVGDPYAEPSEENLWFSNAVVKLYLEYGGDPNYDYKYASSIMEFYQDNNNIWAVKKLLDAGADPWMTNIKGEPFLLTISETKTSMETLIYAAQLGWFDKTSKENIDALVRQYSEYFYRKNEVVLKAYPEHDQDIGKFFEAILQNSQYQATPEMLKVIAEAKTGG